MGPYGSKILKVVLTKFGFFNFWKMEMLMTINMTVNIGSNGSELSQCYHGDHLNKYVRCIILHIIAKFNIKIPVTRLQCSYWFIYGVFLLVTVRIMILKGIE